MDIDVSMLLVPAGVAAIVALLVQFLIKPWLKVRYTAEEHDKYSAVLNTITIAAGIVLGIGAAVAINWGSLTAAGIFTAGLVGLVGGASAIGSAEFLGNWQKASKK